MAATGNNVSNEGVFTSSNYGVSWQRRLSSTDSTLTKGGWNPVAISMDGSTMIASGLGRWHISRDAGRSWGALAHDYLGNVKGVAVSVDGAQIAAAVTGGVTFGLFTSVASGYQTSLGISGSITGGQYDSIELQYIGGGTFIVLSSSAYSSGGFAVN